VELFSRLFDHEPECLVVDRHPEYRTTRFGRAWATRAGLSLEAVQHHHAHVAAVLADNGWPADAGPVLGIALDGLGYGDDGTLWGGELLVADYAGFERAAHLGLAAMPGGTRAILEPWRNTVAHLDAHLGLDVFAREWADLELHRYLADKPTEIVANMIARGINSPLSSSCGRLFDAVAAAIGLCRDRASYEGEAAIELEALVDERVASGPAGDGYPFAVRPGLPQVLDPGPLWRTLLADLRAGVPPAVMAARFHWGLADAVAGLAGDLAIARGLHTVALSGGVAQNRILVERVADQLRRRRLDVLQHRQVPANDGGLSLGQAAVGAMRILMARRSAR
jgi:hydrogenase maturation protein HypF